MIAFTGSKLAQLVTGTLMVLEGLYSYRGMNSQLRKLTWALTYSAVN
jgi:hypothetical protein